MVSHAIAIVVAVVAAQAPASPPALVPELADCRVLVDAGRLAEARACYERVAAVDPPQAALARALADMVSPMVPTAPSPTTESAPPSSPPLPPSDGAPSSSLSLDALAWHGRGELIASAVLTGGAASLAVVGALPIDNYAERSMLSLAAPVLGGGVAGGVAAASVALLPSLRDGDVHLVRAGLWLGAFDAACVGVALSSNEDSYVESRTIAGSVLLTWAAVSGAAIAAAAAVDVDDAAPSLGLSFVWIAALSTGLGFGIADLEATGSRNLGPLIATTVGVAGSAAAIGGVVAGNALHLTRASVWLVDVGAGAGALSAYALATGLRAGTPALGWGTVLGGTVLGAGAGLVAAQRISDATDAGTSPSVSLAPSMLPVVVEGGRVDVVPGAVLSGTFR